MSSFSEKATPYVAGFGMYYLGVWIFTCYPAFITALTFQRMFYGKESEEAGTYFLGLAVMIIGTFVILGLVKFEQYFIVLMIYLLTAWPFLYILNHCCHAEEWRDGVWIATYPLPLDWWPLW